MFIIKTAIYHRVVICTVNMVPLIFNLYHIPCMLSACNHNTWYSVMLHYNNKCFGISITYRHTFVKSTFSCMAYIWHCPCFVKRFIIFYILYKPCMCCIDFFIICHFSFYIFRINYFKTILFISLKNPYFTFQGFTTCTCHNLCCSCL